MTDALNTHDSFTSGKRDVQFASLKKLEAALGVSVARLPVSIRIVLESVLRNCDGVKVTPSTSSSWPTGNPTPTAPKKSPSPWRA